MIKRIIFDIDNTLINVPETIEEGYQQVLDKFNINYKGSDLYDAIGVYETCGKYKKYDEQKLIDTINKYLNLNLDITFMDEFFKMYDNLETKLNDGVKETLEYLSKKYELVCLTNWFTKSQENRLRKLDILKYFKEIYGTDKVVMKPLKDSFLSAIGNFKPNECVIVGDNLNVDIKVPHELGINVYHLNKNGKTKYPTIKNISDLKELL